MPSKGFTHESTYNESVEWYTPREIFKALAIDFDLDPCSPGQDIVRWIPAQIHYTVADNGLEKDWFGNVFMNPPYGMDTPRWMKQLSDYGNGIALVFARPDTKWFHDYVPKADAICFIKGRIGFVPADKALFYADGTWETQGGCGAASMLVAYGKENAAALFRSGLGLTLPIIRSIEDVQDKNQVRGCKAGVSLPTSYPHENPPRSIESWQSFLFGNKGTTRV
jgi:hypothetical protein